MMFAQASVDFQWIIQAATSGGFAALVWYLVVKHIPSITESHKKERDEWLAYMKLSDQAREKMIERCIVAIESLGRHSAGNGNHNNAS